jgi:hypothetical protein
MRSMVLRIAFVSAMLTIASGPASACGFHGALGNSFAALHPRSLDVAIALRDAADTGLLDRAAFTPRASDLFAYHRAVRRLQRLGNAVAGSEGPLRFSLLLVESALWSNFTSTADGVIFSVHAEGPRPADQIVLTGGPVLTAIEAGELSLDEALQQKLIVIVSDDPDEMLHIVSTLRAFAAPLPRHRPN